MTHPNPPAIVWFRRDLRLADHEPLHAAIATGRPVLPIYILDETAPAEWALGGASRWWQHHSLAALADTLRGLGLPLVLRRGPAATVLPALAAEVGAHSIHAGRMHEPWARGLEATLGATLGDRLNLHRSVTLFDLEAVRTKTGGIYGVYTPFANACRARGGIAEPLPVPDRAQAAPAPPSDELDNWQLLPRHPDWAGGMREAWVPGEATAQRQLANFLASTLARYKTGRNLPGEDGTSRLSAHLHWGEISPRQVWHGARALPAGDGLATYLGEILWREFAAYLLWHHPTMPEAPLRPAFAKLPFRPPGDDMRAWQRGQTGIPIVDAGMRQLWRLGWMHNRVRMITASFLVKNLLIDWREGERWFWDTLVDADLATNAASWQWIAGSGTDSQPFFRIFNPVTQGETWDKAGPYVRRWVPELNDLPDRWLHAPWTAPAADLRRAKVTLGQTYPAPIVDLGQSRDRALQAYRSTVRTEAA